MLLLWEGMEEKRSTEVGDGLVLAEEMGKSRVWLSITFLISLCLTCHIKCAKLSYRKLLPVCGEVSFCPSLPVISQSPNDR